MFLFKAFSYGAITDEEHLQSIELVENFVVKLEEAASSDNHIAYRYSKLLRNLLRQGTASSKSQDGAVSCYTHSPTSLGARVNPSSYVLANPSEVSTVKKGAHIDRDPAMDLFQVSPEDTSYTATSFGDQGLWPFQMGTTGSFNDFPFPAIGGEGPNNLDFLTF